ncbi:MAG: STAS domain-containing protein [Acidimicrobiales bacterium]
MLTVLAAVLSPEGQHQFYQGAALRGRRLIVQVTCEETGQAVVCHLQGNLEHATVAHFREAFTTVPPGRPVVFDLSGVPFIDSAGLGALIGAVRRTREMGGEALVCAPRPSVNRVLEIVGLPRIVNVAASVEEAGEILFGSALA